MLVIIISLFAVATFFSIIRLVACVANMNSGMEEVMELVLSLFVMIISPLVFLEIFDIREINDCCTDSAVFSPAHRSSIYVWIMLILVAYFAAFIRKSTWPPLLEIAVNCLLVAGVFLNIFIWLHVGGYGVLGNLGIICLLLVQLIKRHRLVLAALAQDELQTNTFPSKLGWQILQLPGGVKYPVLFLLTFPLLLLGSILLLLFGQQPDSVIRAFTDTYKHGLSQWDYQCVGVVCDGHYLCTVAARGHEKVVKPQRLGVRRGQYIICNRQLLIANAFEDLIVQYLPKAHRPIRRNYDKVGALVERHYHWLDRPWVSNIIYWLMKPLEWVFIITLYLIDRRPEDRIARQYLVLPQA